jgi:hypothetical protein
MSSISIVFWTDRDTVQIGVWRGREIVGGAGPVAWGIKDLDIDLRAWAVIEIEML